MYVTFMQNLISHFTKNNRATLLVASTWQANQCHACEGVRKILLKYR